MNMVLPSGAKVVYVALLEGWYVVRGPHRAPLSGRFATKAEALAWLNRFSK